MPPRHPKDVPETSEDDSLPVPPRPKRKPSLRLSQPCPLRRLVDSLTSFLPQNPNRHRMNRS
jgi:hypothetical protein